MTPVPQLNDRKFDIALGHVLGGGSSINAMVWTRGMQRDFDGWAHNGATGTAQLPGADPQTMASSVATPRSAAG